MLHGPDGRRRKAQPAPEGEGHGPLTPPSITFLDDTFTGVPGTDLLAHLPPIGGAWVYDNPPGAWQLGPIPGIQVSAVGPGLVALAHNLALAPSVDYTAETRFQTQISIFGNAQQGIVARSDGTLNYVLLLYDFQAATLAMYELVGGSYNFLGSVFHSIIADPGHTFLADMVFAGNTVRARINGTTVIGPVLTAVPGPGFVGLWYNASALPLSSQVFQVRVRGYT